MTKIMRILILPQRFSHWRRSSRLKPTVVRSHHDCTAKSKLISSTGLLITLSQFIFTALAASFSQITPTLTLRSPSVPMRKWAYIALMFFAVNMLNNWAFAFNISVPVHIILRSFGSVTTMLAADQDAQGKSVETNSTDLSSGLLILLAAQILSAYMGVYVQDTYATHGSHWRENLFYSHFLSLPLFLPLAGTLRRQYVALSATPPLSIPDSLPVLKSADLPSGIIYLLLNSLTQLACITGVNLLSAQASAVTVTIVLNVRKLVSFVASTILFGHSLSGTMCLGAGLVFGAGALYGWETSYRIPQQRKKQQVTQKKDGKAQ
ncbi:UAA transporter [Aureobasidium sp. EXF-12298]|nr:UAA transporter [Aureobasidium sp. EXF-12298]KAI4764385.1 UAA transporter [Aureobasidium sp. EXF-12344]KAI4781618.1 UAA transporter [Aureobasidium sp. EXF-3400]